MCFAASIDCWRPRMAMSESKDLEAVTAPPAGEWAFLVLLVDDQAIIGEALRRALVNEPDIGFHFCSNPAEAFEAAQEIQPTVILQGLVIAGEYAPRLVRAFPL